MGVFQETYPLRGQLSSTSASKNENLRSYYTATELWKLSVVLDCHGAMETYSRIGLLRSYGNLRSYWTTTKLCKLTVVLDYYEAMKTYSCIELYLCLNQLPVLE